MVRSYAVMFSAVTFRLWLGVLSAATEGDFPLSYGAAAPDIWFSQKGTVAAEVTTGR
jgi:hypothetical protein